MQPTTSEKWPAALTGLARMPHSTFNPPAFAFAVAFVHSHTATLPCTLVRPTMGRYAVQDVQEDDENGHRRDGSLNGRISDQDSREPQDVQEEDDDHHGALVPFEEDRPSHLHYEHVNASGSTDGNLRRRQTWSGPFHVGSRNSGPTDSTRTFSSWKNFVHRWEPPDFGENDARVHDPNGNHDEMHNNSNDDNNNNNNTNHYHIDETMDDLTAAQVAIENDARMATRRAMLDHVSDEDAFLHDFDAATASGGPDRRVHGHVLSSPRNRDQEQRLRGWWSGIGEPHLYSTNLYEHGNLDAFPRTCNRNRLWTVRNAVLFIVAGFVVAYIQTRAPPPPPPHDDWSSYALSSTKQICEGIRLLSLDAGYVVLGLWNNMYRDAVHLKDAVLIPGGVSGNKCYLKVPTMKDLMQTCEWTSGSAVQRLLEEDIVGQSKAVAAVSRALDGWDVYYPISSEECSASDTSKADTHICSSPSTAATYEGGKPLVLLLTGPEGVGKSEMAQRIAKLLFRDCNSLSSHGPTGSMPAGVLQINGRSYANPSDVIQNSSGRSFRNKILTHIRKQHGAGAVIVLKDIESMPPNLMVELTDIIKSSDNAAIDQRDDSWRWDNVLFILTTDLGVGELFKSIRAYEGTEFIPEHDLSLAVRNDIDDYFGSSTALGNTINTIAVLMPLEEYRLEGILRKKIEQLNKQHEGSLWKRLDVTDDALRHFVGLGHIDYLSLKKKDSNDVFYSFSKRGAHTIMENPLLQTLRSIRRNITPHPDKVAVFDYDLGEGKGIMRWCQDENTLQACDQFRTIEMK